MKNGHGIVSGHPVLGDENRHRRFRVLEEQRVVSHTQPQQNVEFGPNLVENSRLGQGTA